MSHRQNSVIGLSHPASTQPASMHQCSMTFGGKAHSIGPSHVHFLKDGQAPGSSGTPQLAACSAITRALFSIMGAWDADLDGDAGDGADDEKQGEHVSLPLVAVYSSSSKKHPWIETQPAAGARPGV